MEVMIHNPKTEESYAIQSADFRRGKHYRDPKTGEMVNYDEAGFRVVANGDGTEYTGPLNDPPAERTEAPRAADKP